MAVEIKIGDRISWVDLVKQDGSLLEIDIDGKILKVDVMHTADGTFSILANGHSYNIELVPFHQRPKKYTAYTLYQEFDVEIIDAEARYLLNRGAGSLASSEKKIMSPMPGKVVKVFACEGEEVTEGQTLVVISAMKMESEYKAPMNGKVKKVGVKEGDTIEGNQILIELD